MTMTTTVQDIIEASLVEVGKQGHNPASIAHHMADALRGVLPDESLNGLTLSSIVPVIGYDAALKAIFKVYASSYIGASVTPQMMQDNQTARAMLRAL
jgi:hypothetical protein